MTLDQERALEIADVAIGKDHEGTCLPFVAAEILRAEARGMHRVLFGAGLENPEDQLATLQADAAELEQAK